MLVCFVFILSNLIILQLSQAPTAFGGQPQQQQQQQQPPQAGSTVVPYSSTNKQDGNNSIVLQSITAMPQYEQKSFEELRLEDYMAGNKGTKGQATPNTGFGGFGSPSPAPSAFGTQPAAAPTAFGAPAASTSLFGSSQGKNITLCQHDRIFNMIVVF